jgi:hypothetical protein
MMEVCVMGIEFSDDWNHAHQDWQGKGKHIVKQDTAIAVITSAANALTGLTDPQIETWREAVNSQSTANDRLYVIVEKNDHQYKGVIDREAHLTMRVYRGGNPHNYV